METHKYNCNKTELIFCSDCDYKTVNKRALYQHNRRMHLIEEQQCDQCDYVAKNKNDLTNHKAKHGGLFQCDQCVYSTVNRHNFSNHMEQHKGLTFSCDICPYTGPSKQLLNFHVQKRHKKEFVFCDQCAYKTRDNILLKKHMERHKGVSYFCDYDQCTFSSLSSHSIEAHKKNVHESSYIYCDQCKYKTKYSLKTHIKKRHPVIWNG